jgi:single-strand DNA-binding protein
MLNRVVLIGRLTRDPESKYTQTGVPVASFGIAVDRPSRNAETGERETDFINITAWRKTAEFVTQYLTKGRLVAVEGRLQIRSWTAQDGTKRTAAEVVADNVQGLDKPRDSGPAPGPGAEQPVPATTDTDADPFGDE